MPQKVLPKLEESPQGDPLLAIISGLNVGGESNQLRLQFLVDFLTGHAGSDKDQILASNIVRLVIAGGTLDIFTE